MKDGIVLEFHRIHNSFPSIGDLRENERVFDFLPFTSEMNLQRSMTSIFKISQSEIS